MILHEGREENLTHTWSRISRSRKRRSVEMHDNKQDLNYILFEYDDFNYLFDECMM
jgi:hypothetical protein